MVQTGVGDQVFRELGCFQEVPGKRQVPYIVPDMGVAAGNDPDLILSAQFQEPGDVMVRMEPAGLSGGGGTIHF